jgi:putative transposase
MPLIVSTLRADLHAYMGGIVRLLEGTALAIDGTVDHVHLLIILPPAVAIADAVRVVKANSSKWVPEKRNRPFNWQTGYAAFSVSQSNVGEVVRYIAEQEAHHRRRAFQEELVAFLKRHGVAYDERYIWE